MGLFKSKEPQEQKQFLFADSIDYSQYTMSLPETILSFLVGFLAGFLVGMVFYNMLLVGIVVGVIVGVAAVPLRRKSVIDKRRQMMRVQFRDMLEAVSTSLSAGLNVPDSFVSAYSDMKVQYPAEAPIIVELAGIINGMNNNFNIEDLLKDFAERSDLDDARSFADVFDTALRRGGDIKHVVQSTYEIINDKMEVEMEIETMITSSKTELKMMMCMPVVLIVLLRYMGGGLTSFDSPAGIMATSVGIVLFVAAYFVGNKIMTIKL